jgi:hypothetical protein
MLKRMFLFVAVVMLLVTLTAQPILSKNTKGGQTINEATALDATNSANSFQVSKAQSQATAAQPTEGQQLKAFFSVRSAGIPTAHNLDHVGITVPNLKEA